MDSHRPTPKALLLARKQNVSLRWGRPLQLRLINFGEFEKPLRDWHYAVEHLFICTYPQYGQMLPTQMDLIKRLYNPTEGYLYWLYFILMHSGLLEKGWYIHDFILSEMHQFLDAIQREIGYAKKGEFEDEFVNDVFKGLLDTAALLLTILLEKQTVDAEMLERIKYNSEEHFAKCIDCELHPFLNLSILLRGTGILPHPSPFKYLADFKAEEQRERERAELLRQQAPLQYLGYYKLEDQAEIDRRQQEEFDELELLILKKEEQKAFIESEKERKELEKLQRLELIARQQFELLNCTY